jgi:hypothetical protein
MFSASKRAISFPKQFLLRSNPMTLGEAWARIHKVVDTWPARKAALDSDEQHFTSWLPTTAPNPPGNASLL